MIRIISGKHKGRVIPTVKSADYRPSTAKFREALFSIVTSGRFKEINLLETSKMLDLYAGTGSLSFEALSRGANSVTLVDTNEVFLKNAKAFAEKIGELDNCSFLKLSAINLPQSGKKYGLVVMDPPYGKNMVVKTLKTLVKSSWLEEQAFIIIDCEKREDVTILKDMEILEERKYGNSKLVIISYNTSKIK